MSVAIATAPRVRVLCYDYHDLQWGEAKTCCIRVVEEAGEYILKIDPKNGGKLIEHKISDEDIEIQLYKGAGFIHVLFTKPTKQLYGIMFSDVAEGKKFYFRMINKIDITHFQCLEGFEIGTDGYPIPESKHGALSQELNVCVEMSQSIFEDSITLFSSEISHSPQSPHDTGETIDAGSSIYYDDDIYEDDALSSLSMTSEMKPLAPSMASHLDTKHKIKRPYPSPAIPPRIPLHKTKRPMAYPLPKLPAKDLLAQDPDTPRVSLHKILPPLPLLRRQITKRPAAKARVGTLPRFSLEQPQGLGDHIQMQGHKPLPEMEANQTDTAPIVGRELPILCASPLLHHGKASSTRQPSDQWLTAKLLTDAINRHDVLEAQTMLNALLSESSAEPGRFEVIYHATPIHTSAHHKPTVAHSDYPIEAEKRMGISFLGHCILECDSHGLEYTNKEHDITVRIPEGAVADGETVHIEFAVAICGPFHFPDNARPILWLCPLERNAKLKKPSQIVFPHALDGLTKEKAKDYRVGFVKVHHNDFNITDSCQLTYTFQPLSSECDPLFSTIGEIHYGLLKTSHFCYLCMTAERNNSELEKDIYYCLTRIEMPITDIRHKAIFCLSYHLPTCIEAIEQQFPSHKFKTSPPFKLTGSPGSVQLVVEESKCTVAMEPILPVLEAKDVDFSTQSIKQLELMHKQETYPPRITMTFDTTLAPQQTLTVRVQVEGTYRDKQLSADLLLPFVDNSLRPPHKSVTLVPHSQNVKDKMDEIPKPSDLEVLKYKKGDQMIRLKIISRASHKWRDIAALVSQDTNKADNLEQKYTNPAHCLRQIFQEDFISKKPTSYSQNWEGLIEVLYNVEEDNLAEEVKHVIEKFADVVV